MVVALLVPVVVQVSTAGAASYSDPSGDVCKGYPSGNWCGADLTGASDRIDPDGTVHLAVAVADAYCVGSTGLDVRGPSISIHVGSAVTPTIFNQFGLIDHYYQTDDYYYRPVGGADIPLTLVVVHDPLASTSTYDIALPLAITADFGTQFTWVVGSNCIGENPWEHADIAPDAGLYAVALSPGAVAPSAPTGVAAAAVSGRSAASVSFTPGPDGGSAILSFRAVCISRTGGVKRSASGLTSPLVVRGLTPGATYRCAVRATNAVGNSPFSLRSDPFVQ